MAREEHTKMIETAEKRYPIGYGPFTPVSDYRPWEIDDAFGRAYASIREHTMVDIYRLYELWQLTAQAVKVPGAVLEVGAWRGGSGALTAARLRALGEKRHVYVADTFAGVVKAGPRDEYYRGGEHANTSADTVRDLFSRLGLEHVSVLEGTFPEETADQVESAQICLCHVDVDVYQSAKDVASWVWPRIPIGGILIYDDYGFYGCEGVTALVDEEYGLRDRAVVHNLNGHAVVIKTA
jgi:O-methyltransferase